MSAESGWQSPVEGLFNSWTCLSTDTDSVASVRVVKDVKMLSVGNGQGHYQLSCNTSQDSCVTPVPGRDYLVFTKETRWKKPGAKDFLTLTWLQGWSGSYPKEENIA